MTDDAPTTDAESQDDGYQLQVAGIENARKDRLLLDRNADQVARIFGVTESEAVSLANLFAAVGSLSDEDRALTAKVLRQRAKKLRRQAEDGPDAYPEPDEDRPRKVRAYALEQVADALDPEGGSD